MKPRRTVIAPAPQLSRIEPRFPKPKVFKQNHDGPDFVAPHMKLEVSVAQPDRALVS